jgi:hypothetical protein
MTRLVLIGALVCAGSGACGADDDRPETLEYITETILAPSCASAQCHSAFKREVGDQYDTVDAARDTIVGLAQIIPGDKANSLLYKAITIGASRNGDSKNVFRMPFDAPLPDADVALIGRWIDGGAAGAQCLADAAGHGCSVTGPDSARVFHIVNCVDGNIGSVVMDCASGKLCSIPTGNGQCK